MPEQFREGSVDDAFSEGIARAEQEAQKPETPPVLYLFGARAREGLLLAALRYRQAAITIEALAGESHPHLAAAARKGIKRYLKDAKAFYREALSED